MVELFSMGVHGRMWASIAHFVHGKFLQFRIGSDLSETWQDSGVAQGRVLSPLFVNIGLVRAVHDACPGVSLIASWDSRFACQLSADDLVIVADSAADLQTGLDAVSAGRAVQIRRHVFWSPKKPPCVQCDIGRCCPGHRVQVPHCLGQLTSSTWWTEATDCLHNACLGAVPNAFRAGASHDSPRTPNMHISRAPTFKNTTKIQREDTQ